MNTKIITVYIKNRLIFFKKMNIISVEAYASIVKMSCDGSDTTVN